MVKCTAKTIGFSWMLKEVLIRSSLITARIRLPRTTDCARNQQQPVPSKRRELGGDATMTAPRTRRISAILWCLSLFILVLAFGHEAEAKVNATFSWRMDQRFPTRQTTLWWNGDANVYRPSYLDRCDPAVTGAKTIIPAILMKKRELT